jgi:quercetin dioxygenase-like cupin family protein
MQSTADIFTFLNGTEFIITRKAGETEGAFLEMEMNIVPGDSATPVHIHPAQEEEYHVITGTFDVNLDGMWQQHSTGDIITIPAGVPHTFRNSSAKHVKVLNFHKPALSFEQYIRTLGRLIMEEKIQEGKFTSMIYVSLLWKKHNDTIRAVGPMRIVMAFLALWGKWRGYTID